jgi:serine O-acetyltransferase
MIMENESLVNKLLQNNKKRVQQFPDKEKAKCFIKCLFKLLFECQLSEKQNVEKLEEQYKIMQKELEELLKAINNESSSLQASEFLKQLPAIYDMLLKDAQALLDSDPAARSIEEVLVTYPGFYSTFVYRIAHQLWLQGQHLLARFFSEYAHSKTGIDIHPGATIGHSFAIDHGTGVVIGETSNIANGVKIYQGVTLGALNVAKENAMTKRHPTIEDNVVIYAGATILGGETVVGEGSIIGGNVWLTYSIPANSVVYHKSEVHVKDNNPFPEPINFVI